MKIDDKFKVFDNDLTTAFYDVQEYKKLFLGSNINNIILSNTAPNFFLKYQRFFWNNIIQTIARFIDPPKKKKNKNLTIDILYEIASTYNLICSKDIHVRIRKIKDKISLLKIKKWRNKIIRHRDAKYALKKDYRELSIKFDDVENILHDIGKCFNLVYGELKKTTREWSIITHG